MVNVENPYSIIIFYFKRDRFHCHGHEGEEIDSVGTVDPVNVMSKWRKYWPADIILVGPTKEPEKPKEEPKKEEPKKREVAKKEEPKRIEGNPYLTTHYHVQSIEENPNACVIC